MKRKEVVELRDFLRHQIGLKLDQSEFIADKAEILLSRDSTKLTPRQ